MEKVNNYCQDYLTSITKDLNPIETDRYQYITIYIQFDFLFFEQSVFIMLLDVLTGWCSCFSLLVCSGNF